MAKTQPVDPNTISGTSLASAYQQIRALQQREWAARNRLDTLYRELTQPYKQELEDAFYRYFVYPADQAPHWDAVPALQSDVVQTLTTAFEDVVADLEVETGELTAEEEDESFLQGFYFGLWDLHQAGADVHGVEPPDDIHALLLAAAIGGIGVLARVGRWIDEARGKLRTGLKATIVGERTLPETVQWFDNINDVLTGRVSSLVSNHSYLAFNAGRDAAINVFPELVLGMVWMTREDMLVCERCRPLHLTITTLRPVIDTHPNCRCYLVPLLSGAGTRPIDFSLFLQEVI